MEPVLRCSAAWLSVRVAHEEAMGMKASEVGAWLRKSAGKRDHYELMPEDPVMLRPGPNFHWLMGQGSPARTEPLPAAPGPTPTRDDRRGTRAEDEAA